MKRTIAAAVTTAALLVGTAPAALAYEPVNVVHTETVQAGPYRVVVGFSTWPVRAMQSLDFTFAPDGGLEGKSGYLTVVPAAAPDVAWDEPLARHPRKRDVWGLDIRAMPVAGDYTFGFHLEGPQGPGEGTLTGLEVLAQPGPPMGLSWALSTLPLIGLVAFLAIAWRRHRNRTATR
ncbi:hypothetical protein V5P93_002756 [Actinokineospora auranticolor]|uniref:Methionine-rich copper-binding protein CopC n=1 Tax=Actinokineospora auranticolor TaxID=155976 RepID=A0A2S6H0F8_9PSEU|nr:hypothetical protein [Actinokineospora auranticolor]PPK70897.1 hypothetical protein CLV40_10183 [Actinokineospora auranticolor]